MCFEDFRPGQTFSAGPRSIERREIDAFTALSGDRTALHSDEAYARTTPFGGLVAHGALVLAVATGMAFDIGIFEGTVLAIRSMDIRFDRPVYPGDALTLKLHVLSKDPHPRADRGRVSFSVELWNERGKSTLSGTWVIVIRRSAEAAGRG
jgi:acyl dehydratase